MLLLSTLVAKEIHPTLLFHSIGYVNDFVLNKNRLYVANDMGCIDIFDTNTQKVVNRVVLPLLVTARNKLTSPNVISVDYLNGKLLILSIGKKSYRNVWIYENYELKQIVDETKKLTIKEARFVNNEQILFSTFGSEVILHDTSEQYNVYKTHISQSTTGDMVLSHSKDQMVLSDESGEVRLIDVATSKVLKNYKPQNLDNVYHVAYNNNIIITAGQDRRVGVYGARKEDYYLKSDFLVYCVGLSPNGKTGVYSSGEENNLQLFNTKTKKLGDILIGHKTPINQIKFKNDYEIYSIGSRNDIFYWKLN